MTKEIINPVRLVDNGIRSFIPPTLCFELHELDGQLVDTVSRVVLGERTDFDAVEALQDSESAATGHVTEYDAGPQARVPGRQFTISEAVHAPT